MVNDEIYDGGCNCPISTVMMNYLKKHCAFRAVISLPEFALFSRRSRLRRIC